MRDLLAMTDPLDTKLGRKVVPPQPISEAEKKAQEVREFETKKDKPNGTVDVHWFEGCGFFEWEGIKVWID